MRDMSVSLNDLGGAPLAGQMAQTVLDMLGRAGRVIDVDPRQAKVFIDQASRLLAPAPATPAERPPLGLAPWQERKITRYIAENLGHSISNGELAQIVGLSVSHFSRRFKASFGLCPRDYVIRSRLERAKALMTETRDALCQIALDCGFCDQAHMSRIFHQIVGNTPMRWRRENALGLAA